MHSVSTYLARKALFMLIGSTAALYIFKSRKFSTTLLGKGFAEIYAEIISKFIARVI